MTDLMAFLVLLLILGLPACADVLMLRRWHPRWWRLGIVRVLFWAMPAFLAFGLVRVLLIIGSGQRPDQSPLVPLMAMVYVPQVLLMAALPIAALIRRLGRRAFRGRSFDYSQDRRAFLELGVAAIPLAATVLGLKGVGNTIGGARIRTVPIAFRDLPPDLDGLKILQISDLHLGGFMLLENMRRTLDAAREHEPDLVVMTGDIVNDRALWPQLLEGVLSLKPRLGVFATLGNHEHRIDPGRAQDEIAATDVTLLTNEGLRLPVGEAAIWLGGIDDISGRHKNEDGYLFLLRSTGDAKAGSAGDDFRILLSHHPDVFGIAAEAGFDLVLAGHRHGGQLGFAGHSVLEFDRSRPYAWGLYEIGRSRLYVTSGAGQWFPFRLGCPAEAPLIVLRRISD